MKVKINYGTSILDIDIPGNCEILGPKSVQEKNQEKLIEKALEKPFGKISIDSFFKNSDKILIIVNDATRPTPTALFIKHLFDRLSTHPNIEFIVATGSHPDPTKEDLDFIFGKYFEYFKDKITIHNAKNKEIMYDLGVSNFKTHFLVNKKIIESKNILVLGSVEPHYFAGYTGGRKAFLPGVSAYETIEMNHKLALDINSKSLALRGNPVHEDMVEMAKKLKNLNIFSIQGVLTPENKLYAVTAGDIFESFYEAVKFTDEVYSIPIQKKANIVVTVAKCPMDRDLYQSQKALEHGKLALEDGGIIILVSKCSQGVGNKTFMNLLEKEKDKKRIIEIVDLKYILGYHKPVKLVQLAEKADIWAVTNLDDQTIKNALMTPYKNVQNAILEAIKITKEKGKQPEIKVLTEGNLTVPNFIKNNS